MINMFSKLLSSFIQDLTSWILNGVIYIYQNVTSLDFNVSSRMSGLGIDLYIGTIQNIIKALAWMVFACTFYMSLMNLITSSIDGSYKTSGSTIIKKLIFGSVLIVFCMPLMSSLFSTVNGIWTTFAGQFKLAADEISLSANISGMSAFLGLIFSGILIYNMITASINQIERFITLYVWYYIAPIAMSFYGSDENNEVPKKYVVSLFLQIATIFINQFLFWIFGKQIGSLSNATDSNVLLNWFVALAMLSLAKNSEKIMNSLGFHTMPSPSSAKDFFAGLAATNSVGKIGWNTAMSAKSAVSGAMHSYTTHAQERARKNNESRFGSDGNTLNSLSGKNSSSKSNNDSLMANSLKSPQDKAKQAQKDNLQTKYNKESKQLSGTGFINSDNAQKTLANELGNTKVGRYKDPFKDLKENQDSFIATKRGIADAQAEFNDSLQKTNDFLSGKDKQGTLSNEDAARALNLDKSMPNFVPTPGGAVRREDNGDFTMHGDLIERDKNGNLTHRPVSMTFSDEDRAGAKTKDLMYGNSGYAVTADSSLRAYETKTKPASLAENYENAIKNNEGKTYRGSNGQADTAARKFDQKQLSSIINPATSLNGSIITSPGYVSDDNNLFFKAKMPNKDGSYDSKTLMMTSKPVNNGEIIEGYMATGRQYSMDDGTSGNSYWAVEMRKPTYDEYASVGEISGYTPAEMSDRFNYIEKQLNDPSMPINTDDTEHINKAMEQAYPEKEESYKEHDESILEKVKESFSKKDDDVIELHQFNANDDTLLDDEDMFQSTDSKDF